MPGACRTQSSWTGALLGRSWLGGKALYEFPLGFFVSLLFGCRLLSVAVNIETVTTVSAAAAAAFVRQIGHFGQRRCLYRLPVVESLAGLHR